MPARLVRIRYVLGCSNFVGTLVSGVLYRLWQPLCVHWSVQPKLSDKYPGFGYDLHSLTREQGHTSRAFAAPQHIPSDSQAGTYWWLLVAHSTIVNNDPPTPPSRARLQRPSWFVGSGSTQRLPQGPEHSFDFATGWLTQHSNVPVYFLWLIRPPCPSPAAERISIGS